MSDVQCSKFLHIWRRHSHLYMFLRDSAQIVFLILGPVGAIDSYSDRPSNVHLV